MGCKFSSHENVVDSEFPPALRSVSRTLSAIDIVGISAYSHRRKSREDVAQWRANVAARETIGVKELRAESPPGNQTEHRSLLNIFPEAMEEEVAALAPVFPSLLSSSSSSSSRDPSALLGGQRQDSRRELLLSLGRSATDTLMGGQVEQDRERLEGGFVHKELKCPPKQEFPLRFGRYSLRGRRPHMEDSSCIKLERVAGEDTAYFGVFDGHGGSGAAVYLSKYLTTEVSRELRRMHNNSSCNKDSKTSPAKANTGQNTRSNGENGCSGNEVSEDDCRADFGEEDQRRQPNTQDQTGRGENKSVEAKCDPSMQPEQGSNPESAVWQQESGCDNTSTKLCRGSVPHAEILSNALVRGVHSVDRRFLAEQEQDESGSALVLAVIRGDGVVAACGVGDSQVLLAREGRAINLCRLHKPEQADERLRIEQAGGRVINDRIFGILSVARAVGDRQFKTSQGEFKDRFYGDLVTCEPDVHCFQTIEESDDFLVLACDGVFDVMSNQQVVNFVITQLEQTRDIQLTTEKLLHHCLKLGAMDNLSAIIVCLSQRVSQSGPQSVHKARANVHGMTGPNVFDSPETNPHDVGDRDAASTGMRMYPQDDMQINKDDTRNNRCESESREVSLAESGIYSAQGLDAGPSDRRVDHIEGGVVYGRRRGSFDSIVDGSVVQGSIPENLRAKGMTSPLTGEPKLTPPEAHSSFDAKLDNQEIPYGHAEDKPFTRKTDMELRVEAP